MAKKVIKGELARKSIIEGVIESADAIVTTLGPSGRFVAIENSMAGVGPEISRDGATVSKTISYKDGAKNTGAMLVRKAATLTEDQVGDSTTTTACLIKEFCEKGEKYIRQGYNVSEIKSGMIKASEWVKDFIKNNSIEVGEDLEKIRKVATISANNDKEVGNLIVESMKKVGIDGVITTELSSGLDTIVEITEGMKIERGWSSPEFSTEKADSKCIMEDCFIFVCGTRLSNVNQIIPFLEIVQKEGGNKPFLMICDGIDDIVISTLLINTMRGVIRCCVVKDIDFGDGRKNQMQDIATKVGATYFCSENGRDISDIQFEDLGHASKVVVSRDSTIIYEGSGDPTAVSERAEILKKRLADPTTTLYDRVKFSKRLANLTNGIAVIKAGGATEVEKCNRKATIEDAILASKSAISEGCIPGGGYMYFKASLAIQKDKKWWKGLEGDEVVGANIVVESLPVILKTIAINAGVSGDVILEQASVKRKNDMDNWGFNAKTRKWGNLLEEGVLDSVKAARVALENSISTASMILATDCIILEDEDEKKAINPMGV
jgi:chaperonin GroEL